MEVGKGREGGEGGESKRRRGRVGGAVVVEYKGGEVRKEVRKCAQEGVSDGGWHPQEESRGKVRGKR